MKTLEQTFVTNADKSGNNKFEQVHKTGQVAMFRRLTMEGLVKGFEVFVFKTIPAGAPLPGGGTVAETYESYPGGKAFGRSAWFIAGQDAEKRAKQRFDALVKNAEGIEVEEVDETPTTPLVRALKAQKSVAVALRIPTEPFTQKELAAFNEIGNYKEVYSPLQRLLADGTLVIHSRRESARGKAAKLFVLNPNKKS